MENDPRFVLGLDEAKGCLSVCHRIFVEQDVEKLAKLGLAIHDTETYFTELGDLITYLKIVTEASFPSVVIPEHHRSAYITMVYVEFPELRHGMRVAYSMNQVMNELIKFLRNREE